jgi:hypothetical protein
MELRAPHLPFFMFGSQLFCILPLGLGFRQDSKIPSHKLFVELRKELVLIQTHCATDSKLGDLCETYM